MSQKVGTLPKTSIFPSRVSGWKLVTIVSKLAYFTHLFTPPKTNMEPKNDDLEDVFSFPMGDFQVQC